MIKKMYFEEGIGAFFKGVLPAIIMTVNPMIQYMIYETLKQSFLDENGQLSSSNIIWISLLSKLVTTIATYPILTIKTLFQSNEKKSTREIINIILDMLENNGFSGLYKGITAKMAQTLINNMLTMLIYEKSTVVIRHLVVNILFKNK